MSRTERCRASRWLCVILAIFWAFVASSSPQVMAQYSAEEILKKSQEAMKPPIQYRLRLSGAEILVSNKMGSTHYLGG